MSESVSDRLLNVSEDLILIGASAGGIEAFIQLLQQLAPDFTTPIVFVMHLERNRESLLARVLSPHSHLPVIPIEDGMAIEPGKIYVCRPGHHVIVERGRLHLHKPSEPQRFLPDINVAFDSAATSYRDGLTVVILSGMLDDGVRALEEVHDQGGLVIVQDPADARFSSMPQAAIDRDHPDGIYRVSSLAEVLDAIYDKHPLLRSAGG